jgi:uncharacterized protein YebE (UPF0316 family)
MFEGFIGPILIMLMRIVDVTIGTFRTILVVQGRKYLAGITGFLEVLIWVFAIRFIFQHLDNVYNLFGYAIGFGLGNLLGISLEQKIGLGFVQLNIISLLDADRIANTLRQSKFGVTILPGEGGSGGVSVIMCVVPRKEQRKIVDLIESIDKKAFISVQSALPYRGFMHGARK